MEESSICNAQQFTQNFEIAIRKAWEKWAFKARKQLTPEDLATEYFEHGVECMELGDTEEAISSFKNALKFRSNFPDACNNLGILFFNTGLPVRAIKYFNQATILDPKNNNAFCNIGNVLLNKGRNIDAINFFKKSIELEQNNPEAWYNYGIASFSLGRFDEAKIQFMEAIKISPDYHQAVNNLGNVFLATGDVVAAVDAFRHTIAICPEYLEAHSNLMLALQYQPEASEQSLFNEAQRFGDSIGNDELFHVEYCDEKDQLKQRIKIGYLSPDFKEHPAAYFLKSIIAAHDRNIFEIHCFFNNSRKDKTTDEFKNLADKWFDCRLLNDESLAEIIENEQIDILVDCAGHTAGNRLGVFALKPARFQVSWLGYPGTTGLTQMDYRITDHIADPEGDADLFHSEKLIRLQKGFLCYMPPLNSPLANCCPYETSLHVTFGSFNNLAKLNDATVLIWCRILKEVKGSRLILKNKSFVNSFVRDLWFDKFMVAGCEPEQLEIFPPTVGEKEHLDCYSEIDIALDTFPYNGTTTTCEALWMGVPVVTLKGNRHASRVGASILSHVGLNELVADSSKKYIDIAVQMAMNLDKRRDLRRNLRNMMVGTICDAKQFAFSVEAYFQKMVANKAF
jgi:predicted O-linked N-acetylglucosamine transferase (SPINDLY family)